MKKYFIRTVFVAMLICIPTFSQASHLAWLQAALEGSCSGSACGSIGKSSSSPVIPQVATTTKPKAIPSQVKTATASDSQTMTESQKAEFITKLQAIVASLIAQINNILVQRGLDNATSVSDAGTASSDNSTSQSSSGTSCDISKSISIGASGPDVECLQQFLVTQNLLPQDSATGNFDSTTEQAVGLWQIKNNIVYPGVAGYGNVGPKTRASIKNTLTQLSIQNYSTAQSGGTNTSSGGGSSSFSYSSGGSNFFGSPISGACGNVQNSCSSGGLSNMYYSGSNYSWKCNGSNGGLTASCSLSVSLNPVDGICGYSNNVCTDGYYSDVNDSGTNYLWNCNGINGGDTVSCTFPKGPANGQCGTANNICTVGTSSDLPDSSTKYLWNCGGVNGGTSASCSAPMNGLCGTVKNICTTGTLNDINDTNVNYLWNCTGATGGTNAQCSLPIPRAGVCGTTNNICTVGTLNDIADSSTKYLWNCDGVAGGASASCNLTIPPITPLTSSALTITNNTATMTIPNTPAQNSQTLIVATPTPGACGTINNSCSAGTSNDLQDTSTNYLWKCNGAGGGAVAQCSLPIPMSGTCGAANNICTTGTSVDVTDTATNYLWKCNGAGGGTTASCSLPIPVNGTCSTVKNICSVGTFVDISDSTTNYIWECNGSNSGANTLCYFPMAAASGVCGTSNDVCTVGTSHNISDTSTNYLWMCSGINGGADASCSLPIPANGACGTANNICTTGTSVDVTDTATNYLWNCNGSGGGTTASCSLPISTPLKITSCVGTFASKILVPKNYVMASWQVNGVSGGSGNYSYLWTLPTGTTVTTSDPTLPTYKAFSFDGRSAPNLTVKVTASAVVGIPAQSVSVACTYDTSTSQLSVLDSTRLNALASTLQAIQDLLKLLVK